MLYITQWNSALKNKRKNRRQPWNSCKTHPQLLSALISHTHTRTYWPSPECASPALFPGAPAAFLSALISLVSPNKHLIWQRLHLRERKRRRYTSPTTLYYDEDQSQRTSGLHDLARDNFPTFKRGWSPILQSFLSHKNDFTKSVFNTEIESGR